MLKKMMMGLAVLSVVGFGQQARAAATQYFYCTQYGANGSVHLSGTFAVKDPTTASTLLIEQEFSRYLATHLQQDPTVNSSCENGIGAGLHYFRSQREAEEKRGEVLQHNKQIVDTGWKYDPGMLTAGSTWGQGRSEAGAVLAARAAVGRRYGGHVREWGGSSCSLAKKGGMRGGIWRCEVTFKTSEVGDHVARTVRGVGANRDKAIEAGHLAASRRDAAVTYWDPPVCSDEADSGAGRVHSVCAVGYFAAEDGSK